MLADFWMPAERKRFLGYAAAAALAVLLVMNLGHCATGTAFNGMFVQDGLAVFFKCFFNRRRHSRAVHVGGIFRPHRVGHFRVLFTDRFSALSGMLFAASANNFAMLFVSIELITVTFYVLTSFQRGRLVSLEAGVKYLILGALSSAFMVYGIALVWGTTGKLNFNELALVAGQFAGNKIFLLGMVLVLVGLGFKIAAFPFQIWAPDVYQGAPTPTTAFLARRFKGCRVRFIAAGFVHGDSERIGAMGRTR